ncbi:MAG TPA: hypothetical protein VF686_05515 [Brevundimonas sp.]|jgi:hypothetical protein
MRIAAGLACLGLLTGCGFTEPSGAAVHSASPLRWGPDIADDFHALPRVAADTRQARAINGFLDSLDVRDREERSTCLAESPENVEWGRFIEAPMTGPRFVSLIVTIGYYCGGAHPYWTQTHYTFDLHTGQQVDWSVLLPDDMSRPLQEPRYSWPALLASPSLTAWFAERALAGMDERGRDDCGYVYGLEGRKYWSLAVWPDAKEGGLGLQPVGLAHAETGCLVSATIPLAELRRRGAAPELTDAIEAAQAAESWHGPRPE